MAKRIALSPRAGTMEEEKQLLQAIRILNSVILGIVLGLITGLTLFAVTLWLVAKGGDPVGPHLALLNQFLPGYSVTLGGSFVGFCYGSFLGFAIGWSIGWIYNTILHLMRQR